MISILTGSFARDYCGLKEIAGCEIVQTWLANLSVLRRKKKASAIFIRDQSGIEKKECSCSVI